MWTMMAVIRRRSAIEVAALTSIGLLAIVALLGPPLFGPVADTPHVQDLLQRPSAQHWLGTDNIGRDIFARVIVATRLSVGLALGATVVGAVIGIPLGAASVSRQ